MHKGKQKLSRFFVVHRTGPALLGMPDIETLGVLTKDDKTLDRKLALGDNADKGQRNCQCEKNSSH